MATLATLESMAHAAALGISSGVRLVIGLEFLKRVIGRFGKLGYPREANVPGFSKRHVAKPTICVNGKMLFRLVGVTRETLFWCSFGDSHPSLDTFILVAGQACRRVLFGLDCLRM